MTKTDSTGTRNYTWDFENRLSSVVLPGSGGTVTLKYDPFGRRIQKSSSSGTTNYHYDVEYIVEELDSGGNEVARYARTEEIDEPLAEVRSGTTAFYQQDGLSSVTSISSVTATLSNTYTYDAFGNLVTSTGSVGNPFQYTGRDFDPEIGLRYYWARYYDSAVGRVASEDPAGFADGLNLYHYVHNKPVSFTDPTGLTSYKGFTPADQALIEAAVQKIRDKLNSKCPSCAGADKDKLLKALDNATIVYNQKLKDNACGKVTPLDYLRHRVEVGPDAFVGCCYKGLPVDSLPSTILHETRHLVYKLPHEPDAYKLENDCFGCRRPPRNE